MLFFSEHSIQFFLNYISRNSVTVKLKMYSSQNLNYYNKKKSNKPGF